MIEARQDFTLRQIARRAEQHKVERIYRNYA
jgi:hypothetical protein